MRTGLSNDGKPLKICYVTTISLTLKTFVLDFAKYVYEKYGWDITFICDDDNEFSSSLPSYIKYIPVLMKRGISFDFFRAVKELKAIFENEHFDIVQYSTPNASLYASIAAKRAQVPIRLYCQWGMVYVGFSGLTRTIFRLEEKYVCALSSWIEPDSPSNLRFAHEEGLYPVSKGSVVWNGSACGVDFDKFDINMRESYRSEVRSLLGIPFNDFVVGFVGRVTRDKGVNELFEAMKAIIEKRNDISLVMVGPTEIDNTINRTLYSWISHCEKVHFVGYTTLVERYLSAMDCYVLPSYREGFGMGVIEAESMGLPVIVTNIPGPIDAMLPGKTGYVVDKQNATVLADSIMKIYNNQNEAAEMSKAAVRFAHEYFDRQRLFEAIVEDRLKLASVQGLGKQ